MAPDRVRLTVAEARQHSELALMGLGSRIATRSPRSRRSRLLYKHRHLPATAPGTDKPVAPIQNRRVRAV
jgi:hypothetical protein